MIGEFWFGWKLGQEIVDKMEIKNGDPRYRVTNELLLYVEIVIYL